MSDGVWLGGYLHCPYCGEKFRARILYGVGFWRSIVHALRCENNPSITEMDR